MNKAIILITLVFSSLSFAVERPPQFVNLAFDGSKSTNMWQSTIEFAAQENIKFTYFISGVYFLTNSDKHTYQNPHRNRTGRSDIGFGGKSASVKLRNSWVIRAINDGHEIASHANGHFNGSKWGINTWISEFKQFMSFLINSPNKYGGADLKTWNQYFQGGFMAGFRAPLLGHSSGMFHALKNQDYVYDTSKILKANYWPKRTSQGIWNFPLASLRMARSGKATASMDYNLYVAQSGGKKGNAANYKAWEDEVYETYMKYFMSNYKGNRAPLDIGHHFSLWNGGTYWKAMKRFAKAVCHLPEVICGTYQDQVEYLNSKSSDVIQAFQGGNFTRMNLARVDLPELPTYASYTDKEITDEELLQIQKQGSCNSEAHREEHIIDLGEGVYL